MSAGDVTPGRRVGSIDDLERAADYFYNPHCDPDAAGHVSLWFYLPTADVAKGSGWAEGEGWVPQNGRHRIASPVWTITEEPDGTVTASPSIGCGQPFYWHGYLEHGVWREV